MKLILNQNSPNRLHAGTTQMALAAALVALLPFASSWRLFATLEVAAYFAISGGVLIIYGTFQREIPLKDLASTWLPLPPQILVIFLVAFGSGIGLAEAGQDTAGIILITLGYVSLGARSALRLFGRIQGH